jgi:hypothetical protein
VGYPLEIHVWNVVISAEVGPSIGEGGIGATLFCMRSSDACASVILPEMMSARVRSEYVTSEREAPPATVEPWQLVQYLATIA